MTEREKLAADLKQIRKQIVDSGQPLLTWEEITGEAQDAELTFLRAQNAAQAEEIKSLQSRLRDYKAFVDTMEKSNKSGDFQKWIRR